jgi:hypothetical protein
MKKMITYFVLVLFLCGALLFSCSNDEDAETEPEKGMIEEMTHKAAKKAVNRIRTPLNKARSAAGQEQDRLNHMEKSLNDE